MIESSNEEVSHERGTPVGSLVWSTGIHPSHCFRLLDDLRILVSLVIHDSGYSGVTLNVARPDMNNYATLGVVLY